MTNDTAPLGHDDRFEVVREPHPAMMAWALARAIGELRAGGRDDLAVYLEALGRPLASAYGADLDAALDDEDVE